MSKKKTTAKRTKTQMTKSSPAAQTAKTAAAKESPAADVAADNVAAPTPDSSPADEASQTAESAAPKVDELTKELAEAKDLYLRAIAEADNQRKRADEQITKATQFAVHAFATGICDVRDCLEKAFATLSKDDQIHEGVSLTLRKLEGVMEQHGVRPVRPDHGAPFDPNLHQSIGVAEDKNLPPNSVATVIQCGYTLNGRTIRAALVHLNKISSHE